MPASERAAVLLEAAARSLEARRGELIEVAASETGKVFAEADVEVSEAVDFANYYAATARELDRVSGAVFEPSRLTVVTPPWNFPIAIPAGGVLAALAAGSGVVFKPAPQARRCAAVVAEALWEAGVPRDVLALVDIDEGSLGQRLVSHPDVDRVILTGSWETAALFRSWRPELPLLAETSGKNAMIVMPSADLDLAAGDVIKSAFGHAGQKCSAASLAILVGPVGRSKRFARQLVDAAASLRVGPPSDPLAEVGPVIEPPQGKLAWALTTLEEGEQWLVEPQRAATMAPEYAGRFWSPGIRTGVQPGSRFHREEFFGPVLGIMHAHSLAQAHRAAERRRLRPDRGPLHAEPRRPRRLARPRRGGQPLRQPRHHRRDRAAPAVRRLEALIGRRRHEGGRAELPDRPRIVARHRRGRRTSATLHLRGLDSRISGGDRGGAAVAGLRRRSSGCAAVRSSDAHRLGPRVRAGARMSRRLGVERNLFRYRPISEVAVRATADATWQALLRVAIAGIRAGSSLHRQRAGRAARGGSPLAQRPGDRGVRRDRRAVDPAHRGASGCRRGRSGRRHPPLVRRERAWSGSRESVAALHGALAEAVGGDPDLAVYDNEVTTAGRLELLPFLHEQSITITAHRFGNPDPWSRGRHLTRARRAARHSRPPNVKNC